MKYYIKELIKIYSNEPSFFSKRKVESGITFLIAQSGMIFFLIHKYSSLSMGEFLLWSAMEFTVAGYVMNKIYTTVDKTKDNNDPKS